MSQNGKVASTITEDPLFQPIKVGTLNLAHRVVLAPLTRNRCVESVPQDILTTYYSQRATPGGLLITEATGISPSGLAAPTEPGIWSDEQVEAWRKVVAGVKQNVPDAVFILQLWHKGRATHSDFIPGNQLPVAPSAIPITDYPILNREGKYVPHETPRALTIPEIQGIIQDYRKAAINAKRAGFDGVEVHSANGYLLNQFLCSGSNIRTDEYGGSVENRIRLTLQVTEAVVEAWGDSRQVGIRLSPFGKFGSMHDDDPVGLFSELTQRLNKYNLAYVHYVEPRLDEPVDVADGDNQVTLAPISSKFNGVVIVAGGHTPKTARDSITSGQADLVAFGRRFISNPDLPERLRHGWPLADYDRSTFFTHDIKGYIDYPRYDKGIKANA